MTADLLVPARFCGPPTSGNGGWTAGALAAYLASAVPGPTIEVTLHAPPPLDTPMAVTTADDLHRRRGRGLDGGRRAHRGPDPHRGGGGRRRRPRGPRRMPTSAAPARRSRAASCAGCDRAEGDGLRIFSGPVDGNPDLVAATWTPHETSVPLAWAALDCPGGWAGGLGDRLMVLGRMSVRLDALPEPGERHVVVGAARGRVGRKTSTATSLYDGSGRLVGARRAGLDRGRRGHLRRGGRGMFDAAPPLWGRWRHGRF